VELFGEVQRGDEFRNFTEKFAEWRGVAIQIDEDEILPGVHAHGDEAVVGAFKIADALKFNHAFQSAVVAIGPAVIRTTKIFRATVRFRDHGRGMVAADIVKGAEFAVVAAHDDQRLFVHVDGEELAGCLDLVEVADNLPVGDKDGVTLELRDAFVEIPGRRNGPGFFERVGGVIQVENVAKRVLGHRK
jgi:hypothetical protein